ncbi:MAG: His-Xaa-Ser system radical SAM maturase HxsC [Muribaculaceae bacterium]|nr:His-Xaa-Ser system radical SAM maturase HxsC [Muribaculaceae bacterium]
MRGDFRIDSNDNTLFTTAGCNNNCIMCCQPPLDNDDIEELYQRNIEIINRAPKNIPVVGISGGEPTLLGDKLVDLLRHIRQTLPDSDIHILSNGRNFKDIEYTRKVVEAANDKLFVGVPLHSDYYRDHDIIAGAKEAYNETIAGIFNLGALGAVIELRIVINKLNYMRLPQMADFIHKNLPFVAWTAFMAMEHIGHAVSNECNVWVEPINYADKLAEAVLTLAQWRKEVAIYNVPLCLIPEQIHRFAQKSISEWKNKYLPECNQCSLKSKCCGLFATSQKPFNGLKSV